MAIVSIKDCGQGLNKDLMAEELVPGQWTDCLNMRFRDGFAERFKGMQSLFSDPLVTPYWIAPYSSTTMRYWVHAGLAKVYVDDGTTRTDISNATAFTGAIDDRWTGGSLNGVFICNNKADQPQYWGGDVTVKLQVLPGWVSTHRVGWMRPWKNYILCGDVTKGAVRYPHMLKWSAVAVAGSVPSTWDVADATQDAAERDLAETADVMVDGLPLGDAFIIYKERSMYSVTQTFDSRIFRTARLPGNSGMLTRGCAVSTPLGHVVLTAGDLIVHAGQGVKSIVSGRMRNWLFNSINSALANRCFVTSSPKKNEVWVCFPSTDSTSCDTALVWNWTNDSFGIRTLANVTYGDAGQVNSSTSGLTWDSATGTWESFARNWDENEYAANESRLVFCHLTKLSLADTGTTDFGAAFTGSIERVAMHFDDPYTTKVIRCVYPRIDAPAGTVIAVQVGSSMNANVPPTWSVPVNFTVGAEGRIKVDTFSTTGRFLALRFTSYGFASWRMRSCDLDIKQMGTY